MKTSRDPELLIKAFLDDGVDELPDRSFDAVRSAIEQTSQRVAIGPWREEQMTRIAMLGIAAAVVVLVVVVGIRFLPGGGGVGSQPTPTPTLEPTPVADPSGRLTPGTYVAHPFREPNRAMSFTFEVPSDSWEAINDPGQTGGVAKAGDSDGLAMTFLQVSSLNGDPCNWASTADDVSVGPTVDDLVSALTNETEYDTSEPEEVTLGGYTGKKVVVTMPDDLRPGGNEQPGCDERIFMIWNVDGFGIYAQGPANRWTLWILDVEGERVVVHKSDFADSDAALSAELDAIVDSIGITAP